ncbi:hypothetical protein B0H14DRAFT_3614826 [Mycena olivaceomarginata]|nr:hypothetical protein B0H14DRAFT_3614826 [Mycena olivaceomarginata]
MSCWLDTSLQLFWVTAERDYESWLQIATDAKRWPQKITGGVKTNDGEVNVEHGANVFSYSKTWMYDVFAENDPVIGGRHEIHTFFRAYTFPFRSCVGVEPHWQNLQCRSSIAILPDNAEFQILAGTCKTGSRISRISIPALIHRSGLAGTMLTGIRHVKGRPPFWTSSVGLPMMLVLHVNPGDENEWDIPQQFSPIRQRPSALKAAGVVYDLVGHGYVSAGMKHFCARFLSQDGKKMYDYDGMKHDGHAVPNNASNKGLTHRKFVLHDSSYGV